MSTYFDQDQFPAHVFEVKQMVDALAALGIELPKRAMCLDMGGGRGQHASCVAGTGRRVHVTDVIPYHALAGGAYIQTLREIHAKHERPFPLGQWYSRRWMPRICYSKMIPLILPTQ
jgi:hypothetical protein